MLLSKNAWNWGNVECEIFDVQSILMEVGFELNMIEFLFNAHPSFVQASSKNQTKNTPKPWTMQGFMRPCSFSPNKSCPILSISSFLSLQKGKRRLFLFGFEGLGWGEVATSHHLSLPLLFVVYFVHFSFVLCLFGSLGWNWGLKHPTSPNPSLLLFILSFVFVMWFWFLCFRVWVSSWFSSRFAT